MMHCANCNEELAGKIKFCRKCHKPTCQRCSANAYCNTCNPMNADQQLIEEYFAEKYAMKLMNVVTQ